APDAGEQRVDPRSVGAAEARDELWVEEIVAAGYPCCPLGEGGGGEIATGKRRAARPCRMHVWKRRCELLQNAFGDPAEGGDLAADDRNKRGLAGSFVEVENVVAGGFLRLAGAVVIERAHPGIGPADHRAAERAFEILADRVEQVVGLRFADRHL